MIRVDIKVITRMTPSYMRRRRVYFDDGTDAFVTKKNVVDKILDAYMLHKPVQVVFNRFGRIVDVRELDTRLYTTVHIFDLDPSETFEAIRALETARQFDDATVRIEIRRPTREEV